MSQKSALSRHENPDNDLKVVSVSETLVLFGREIRLLFPGTTVDHLIKHGYEVVLVSNRLLEL